MASRRSVKDVLQAALAKLARFGWVKNESGNRRVGYCLTGAINASTKSEFLRIAAVDALWAAIDEKYSKGLSKSSGLNSTRLQIYNDDETRRKQSIMALYRRAIRMQG